MASWCSFDKSMTHDEALESSWHTEGGRLHGMHHMTPVEEQECHVS